MPGRDDDEHVGYPMSHLFRRRNGDADDLGGASEDTPVTPVDLAAVQADDALLNTLGRADVARGDADAELARVLVAWRREVDTESISQLVDIDTAVATISAARKSASRRHPVLRPVAAAAAVLVVAFSGVGLVAKSAQPGDQLFPLTKVLYADYARSVETAEKVETELAQAKTALAEGKTSQAKESLALVREQLPVVNEAEGRTRLAIEHRELEQRLGGPASPAEADSTTASAPLTSSPEVPVDSAPPSQSATTTTTVTTTPSVPSSSGSEPPPPTSRTASSPAGPVRPESPTPQTRPGGSVPSADEGSPPPVTTPSG